MNIDCSALGAGGRYSQTHFLNAKLLRLVFKPFLTYLYQLQNKVFKNSTAFKNHERKFRKTFSYVVFHSFPNLLCFLSSVKADQDTITLVVFHFFDKI